MVAMVKSAWDSPLGGIGGNADASLQAAYRRANEEDTRDALNCIASAKPPQLEFFVLSGAWMATVLDFLQGRAPEKPDVRIENATLVVEHAVSSSSSSSDDEEDSTNNKTRRKRKQSSSSWRTHQLQNSHAATYTHKSLKSHLTWDQDYVLVGAHVWTVLSSKFGYDYALPRKVVRCDEFETKLGVLVQEEYMPIAVPASGHYTYNIENLTMNTNTGMMAPVVADDDETSQQSASDLFPGYPNTSPQDHEDNAMDTEMEEDNNNDDDDIYSTPPRRNVILLPAAAHDNDDDDDDLLQVAQVTSVKRKRHASGLSNLGNTCFMNSTLQCLAHADPLRRYFLSQDFLQDLNRDNPLGTGGELASQFASLLREMWTSTTTSYYSNAVYPRSFKTALGKHAEQFMGYDQHDSQEFATYLLDALHEDTNRITNKPYIEKPEQGPNQTDEHAAQEAWKLHLQREDSKVLDNFMGLVKSRVTCPTDGCGRISTTFDPFMYLSVPIPGSSELTLPVTLTTLDHGSYTFSITIHKLQKMEALLQMVLDKYKAHTTRDLDMRNLICLDIFKGQVYKQWEMQQCVDDISDNDVARIYELVPVDEIVQKEGQEGNANHLAKQALENATNKPYSSHQLDIGTLKELNVGDKWIDVLSHYMRCSPRKLDFVLLSAKRSSHEERVDFYQKLQGFIELCHLTWDGTNNSLEDDAQDTDAEMATTSGDENPQEDSEKSSTLPSLQERSQSSNMFQNVDTVHDLAKLEFCSAQFRKRTLQLLEASTTKCKNGIVIEVVMRHKKITYSRHTYGDDQIFCGPLILRVPSNMTVYGLREELALRLSRDLKTDHLEHSHHKSRPKDPPPPPPQPAGSDDMMDVKLDEATNVSPDESNAGSDQSDAALPMETSSSERPHDSITENKSSLSSSFDLGSPDLLIMRQIPLTYRRDTFKGKVSAIPRQLGMLDTFELDGQPMTLANKDDESEQHTIAEVVGDHGRVELNWSEELCNRVFDVQSYEASETVNDPDQQRAMLVDKKITVKNCIDKYCQMEQLDTSEMWYCNRCKDHVRAWKQFHLYRAPPILIVHLKRFQYSSSTHRRDKIDTFIDFPLEGLDLTNEFTEWTEETKPIYDCFAVSNHFGGLGGGHYTAFCLSDDGTWTDFDDSRVTTDVDPKNVVSKAAYVLYYRRRDVVLDGLDDDIDMDLEAAVPAIVRDSYYQSSTVGPAPLMVDNLDNDMDADPSLENEVQSTDAASSTGSNNTVENEDPFVSARSSIVRETIGEFHNSFPSQ